jgi:hypothetical protein
MCDGLDSESQRRRRHRHAASSPAHPCTQRPLLTQSCTSACIVSFPLHSRAVKMVKGTLKWHPSVGALHCMHTQIAKWPCCNACQLPCIHSSSFASNRGRLWFLAETCWSLEGLWAPWPSRPGKKLLHRSLELNALIRIWEKMEHIFKPDGPNAGLWIQTTRTLSTWVFFLSYHQQNKQKMRVVFIQRLEMCTLLHYILVVASFFLSWQWHMPQI